jgi:hypothetical protein
MPYSLQRTFLPAAWRWRVRLDGAQPREGYDLGKGSAKRAAARAIGRLRHSKRRLRSWGEPGRITDLQSAPP